MVTPKEVSVLEPLEHSVLGEFLEGGEVSTDEVALLYPLEHSGVGRAADVVSETSVLEPLEHLVLEVPWTRGESVDSKTVSDPLEHSDISIHAEPLSVCLPRTYSEEVRNGGGGPRDHRVEDSTLQDPQREGGQAGPAGSQKGPLLPDPIGAPQQHAPWEHAVDMEICVPDKQYMMLGKNERRDATLANRPDSLR